MAAPNLGLSDALVHDSVPSRARSNMKVVVLPFLVGFGCALLWLHSGEQPLDDFEGATSMFAQQMQLVKKPMPNLRQPVAAAGAKGTNKGLSSEIEDEVVRNNLAGISRFMQKKGWVDSQGRQGKGYGVYRFVNKYGANVDGYSPIYSPDEWSEAGDTFSLGTKGLIAWAGLVLILLGVGVNLVISTSQLG